MPKRYILYGSGVLGKKLLDILGKDQVLFFCESNLEHPKCICGVQVIDSSALVNNLYSDCCVIIATDKIRNVIEISKYLDNIGINYLMPEDVLVDDIYRDAQEYQDKNVRKDFDIIQKYNSYHIMDKYAQAGSMGTYFWQDLWAAKKIYCAKPDLHYDIGSRFDGFIAHLLSFDQKVKLIDIRPFPYEVTGVDFTQADATNLESVNDNSISSLSALCAIEHFGLGRYGDPVDPEACFKCFKAIQKKVRRGGKVYISVPIGENRVEFNAHRVFTPQTIVDEFSDMELEEFSVCRENNIEINADFHKYDHDKTMGGGIVGLFSFIKRC